MDAGWAPLRRLEADPEWVRDLCEALDAARPGLETRPVHELASVLGGVGARFLDPDDALRQRALEVLPPTSGLSPAMAAAVLDGMAADWTEERLIRALERDLGDPAVLDGFVSGAARLTMAVGPRFCLQVAAGTVPGVGVTALLRSLLVKSPTLLKPGLGDVALPVLFARGLREADPSLADALAVVYWPGGSEGIEDVALSRATLVIAYGGDAALAALRGRVPVTARFVAYHHRASYGFVARAALARDRLRRTVAEVAGAVGFFDQRGCVSPQIIYVERGGETDPLGFAEQLGRSLGHLEARLPGGGMSDREAVHLQQVRGTAEVLGAAGSGVSLWHGGEASWTVIFDPEHVMDVACAGRAVGVRPIDGGEALAEALAASGPHLQTVGVAGVAETDLERLGRGLARVGVTRVTPFGSMPFPPPWWHHDGGGPFAELVRWVDLEVG